MKRKRKAAGDGYAYTFHGSYAAKSKAEAKARKRGGFLISRIPRGTGGKRRYIVLTERVPF